MIEPAENGYQKDRQCRETGFDSHAPDGVLPASYRRHRCIRLHYWLIDLAIDTWKCRTHTILNKYGFVFPLHLILKSRLKALGEVTDNGYFLSFKVDAYELIIFPEGRTMIKGTTDESIARTLFAKYVGA